MAHSLFSSSNAFSILFFLSLPSLLTSEFIPNTLSLSVSWSHQTHTHLYPNAICRVSPPFLFTLFPLLNTHYVYNSSYHSVLLSLSLISSSSHLSLSHHPSQSILSSKVKSSPQAVGHSKTRRFPEIKQRLTFFNSLTSSHLEFFYLFHFDQG